MAEDTQSANLRQFMSRKPAKVVAVCSGKGGVGKTNVAANLAIALAVRGRNTCLLDADLSLANVDVLLGLQPRFNLSHVIRGEADLESTVMTGPNGVRVVPASSGGYCMTDLPAAQQVEIIRAFSELTNQPEVMVVDTAPGISASVARFVQAAQYPIVVLCDEPASLTDAYALIKVFSQNYGMSHFHVVTNQSRRRGDGQKLFQKLLRVSDAYLDVVLRHVGDIPHDEFLVKSVQQQRAVTDVFPNSKSGSAFTALATTIESLPVARDARGGIEFFFEHLLRQNDVVRGKVA